MTLVCKPKGKGNWNVYLITIDRDVDFVNFRVGMTLPFGPWIFRVVEVRP